MLAEYIGQNVFITLAVLTTVAFTGQLWIMYYRQFIKGIGWFKPVAGKASFLGFTGILTVMLFVLLALLTGN